MSNENEMIDKCGFCNLPAIKKCSACKQISYCSKEHQTSHWKTHKKFCKPFLVGESETKGRILVATREIKCNEVVLKEEPLVIGPKFVSPSPVCLGCLKPILAISSSSKCPKCGWPICDEKCKGLGDIHQIECDFLMAGKKKGKKSWKYELITPIRCLLQQKHNQDKWNLIWGMKSHMNQRKEGSEVYREIQNLYEYLERNILKNLTERVVSREDFHRICGILDVNSLDVGYGATDGNLSALYPTFSILEHCCLPNVKISVSKFSVVVRAAKSILKDENIAISYTNILWGTQVRQRHLLETKYFTCSCIRCEDPSELDTNFSSIKCLQDNCKNGYLLLENTLDANSSWKCNRCGITMSAEDVDDILSRLSGEVEHFIEQKTPDIIAVQLLLKKLLSVLHPNHYHCFSIKHLMVQLFGHNKGYPYSQMNNDLLRKKIEYCRELLYILSRLDPTASRVPLYSAIANYELSSAILEVMKRTLAETMNLPLIQDDGEQAKRLLTTAVSLLSDTKGSDTTLQLIYSCKCLYKVVEDVMRGEYTLVDT